MNYLIDSNIFLEILLEQEKSAEAKEVLSTVDINDFFITDFTLHSIGVKLFNERLFDKFQLLMSEMIERAGLVVIALYSEDTENLIAVAQRFTLDFDDAYQYCAMDKYDLILVSFDTDFDRTDRGRKTPIEVLRRK
ncbi:MAG: type II toxin-antitoxin system VapC family toxin [Bacteroidetes bacterium]|nr:MAG: type II toxin-antitoxin system VapC family toxin [Bacteroidota bacterium]